MINEGLYYAAELIKTVLGLPIQDLFVLSINLLLFIFAKRILNYFYYSESESNRFLYRLRLFRFINVFVFLLYGFHIVNAEGGVLTWKEGGWDFKIILILVTVYIAYLVDHIAYFFIQQRFGREREVNGEKLVIETYNTRLLGILSTTFILVVSLITIIRILGFNTWLEAGGVVGFVGVFLALTQSSWAPDIFAGLIILNSGIMEEGDAVEISGEEKILGVVFKTKMFHTEILNMVNNHRIMIRNARLRDYVVHNLSRFASAKGLREQLHFNVGYAVQGDTIRSMLDTVFTQVEENKSPNVECQHGYELMAVNSGDYAVEWVLFYYIKDVRNILKIRADILERVVQEAKKQNLDLATPMLNNLVSNAQ